MSKSEYSAHETQYGSSFNSSTMKLFLVTAVLTMLASPIAVHAFLSGDAAKVGHADAAKNLIENGADVNAHKNHYVGISLHRLIGESIEASLKSLAPDARRNNGGTLLHEAAKRGAADAARTLIENGEDLDFKDNNGETALHLAAKEGNVIIVKLLIECGADVNARDNHGATPLHLAAGRGHEEVLSLLIENGVNPEARSFGGRTPLHSAAGGRWGNADAVKLLIERGADANARDNYRTTPLHLAAKEGNVIIVKLLIECGADVNARDNHGATPLHSAAQKDVVMLLIENGADVNVKDNSGTWVLDYAGRELDDIGKLISEGIADANFKTNTPQPRCSGRQREAMRTS